MITTVAIGMLTLVGCVYVLKPSMAPSQHRLKLVTKSPERYSIRAWYKEYSVGADGKVLIDSPETGRGCDVYLFGRIPISRRANPLKVKSISLLTAGATVRTLSLNEFSKLPVDSSGDSLLTVAGGH